MEEGERHQRERRAGSGDVDQQELRTERGEIVTESSLCQCLWTADCCCSACSHAGYSL